MSKKNAYAVIEFLQSYSHLLIRLCVTISANVFSQQLPLQAAVQQEA